MVEYEERKKMSDDPSSVPKPRLRVTGENYEVGGTKAIISMIIGHIRMLCFAILFLGESIFGFFGGINSQPDFIKDFFNWVKENKMQFGLMSFFLLSMIQTSLM